MGFYQPAQLVRDAKEHGVEVRPCDILESDWDCTLEPAAEDSRLKAVRLGFRQISGFRQADAEAIHAARLSGAKTLEQIARRAGLSRAALEKLAEADALRSLGLDRREGLWAVKGLGAETTAAPAPLYQTLDLFEEKAELPAMPQTVHVAEDFRTTSLSLKAHPVSFFREELDRMGCRPAGSLKGIRDGTRLTVAGLVLIRQRPGSAKGVMFMTLEDESGVANAVIWPDIFEKNRRLCMTSAFIAVHGRIQSQSDVIHVVAERFTDLTHHLADMRREDAPAFRQRQEVKGRLIRSRDFH
jgi:error-prone DNA polymerase